MDLETIAEARAQLPGARAHVAGVVTVGLGLVGIDGLVAIQDSTGGIFVRLPAPYCELPIGRSVELEGTLSAPYGQLEIRELDWLAAGPEDKEPAAIRADLEEIGERTEGSLVTIRGTVESVQTDGGRLMIVIGDGLESVRALADPPAGLSRSDVVRGDVVLATGIVGQHATATDRLDGYRLWLRRATDITVRAQIPTDPPYPTARPAAIRSYASSGGGLGNAGSSPQPGPGRVAIASLSEHLDREITVAGLVTEAAGGTIWIDDGTGTVRVGGPAAAEALSMLEPGDAIEVTGLVRQDGDGLIVEADPASIVDLPGYRGEAPVAGSTIADPSSGVSDQPPAPATSPAGAASIRIASSPAAPPDGATLVAVLVTVLATVAGAVVLSRRPGWIHRLVLHVRLRRPLMARGRGR
jgi:DNA/RNA endonuclease YhcR with UshA esterase domain